MKSFFILIFLKNVTFVINVLILYSLQPWWYYEKDDLKNTPSNRDFVDHATEKRYYLYKCLFHKQQ